jgi:hypothetical protein
VKHGGPLLLEYLTTTQIVESEEVKKVKMNAGHNLIAYLM